MSRTRLHVCRHCTFLFSTPSPFVRGPSARVPPVETGLRRLPPACRPHSTQTRRWRAQQQQRPQLRLRWRKRLGPGPRACRMPPRRLLKLPCLWRSTIKTQWRVPPLTPHRVALAIRSSKSLVHRLSSSSSSSSSPRRRTLPKRMATLRTAKHAITVTPLAAVTSSTTTTMTTTTKARTQHSRYPPGRKLYRNGTRRWMIMVMTMRALQSPSMFWSRKMCPTTQHRTGLTLRSVSRRRHRRPYRNLYCLVASARQVLMLDPRQTQSR